MSRHVSISSINVFRQNIRQSNQRGHLQIFSSQIKARLIPETIG